MSSLDVLKDLQDRITALEQQLGDQPGADSLQPNVLTVTPGGQIGAQFTGHVSAQGVDLPAGTNTTGPSTSRVRWLRTSDNAVIADLYAFQTGGSSELDLTSYGDAGRDVNAVMQASNTGRGVASGIQLEAGNSLTGADLVAAFLKGATLTIGKFPANSNALQSSFLQLVTLGQFAVQFGATVLNFPNANRATSVSVTHGIGRIPFAIVFGVNDTGVGGLVIQPGYSALAANTFTLGASCNNVINGNQTIDWAAFG